MSNQDWEHVVSPSLLSGILSLWWQVCVSAREE